MANTTSTPIGVEGGSYKAVGKGYVNTENNQLASICAIFTSTYHIMWWWEVCLTVVAWKPAFSNPVTNVLFIDNCVLNSLVFSLTAYASWCPWWGLHNRQRGEQFLAQNPVPSGPPMSGNASTYPNSTYTLTYIQTLLLYTYSQFLHFKWM